LRRNGSIVSLLNDVITESLFVGRFCEQLCFQDIGGERTAIFLLSETGSGQAEKEYEIKQLADHGFQGTEDTGIPTYRQNPSLFSDTSCQNRNFC